MSVRHFHFTIGPVQAFVAQARRTRDFWAGSFILSWLSAVAMRSAIAQGAEIAFPSADPEFIAALEAGGDSGPRQGTVPNRFRATVDESFDPNAVVADLHSAWQGLAESVWYGDGLDELAGDETRHIWERQVGGFWEIAWAVTDDSTTPALDRRKNWRSCHPPEEPGLKCMVMEGWQELSGAERPGGEARTFWSRLRAGRASGLSTDLREGEQLCAIAYIKRRLTRHFDSLDVRLPGGWTLRGWRLPDGVPSVVYMAAAHWLAETIARADEQILWAFHDAARKLTGGYGEHATNLRCVREAVDARGGNDRWTSLDGSVLFEEFLDNKGAWDDEEARATTKASLGALKKSANTGSPSPFYALLLMDGDSLGVHMSEEHKQGPISRGLEAFTRSVPEIVQAHNGFPIYAGGDDVLAMLPLEDALSCAAALRKRYLAAFDGSGIPTTLSGAIQFAHVRVSLASVLADAHDLLDNVAKEQTGRDALAVRVWKPGGMNLQWAMPWATALDETGEQTVLATLAETIAGLEEGASAPFASRFFYRIREQYAILNPTGDTPSDEGLGSGVALDLLAADFIGSGVNEGRPREERLDMEAAREHLRPLIAQCTPQVRRAGATLAEDVFEEQPRLEADGALLVRFLAQKGVER